MPAWERQGHPFPTVIPAATSSLVNHLLKGGTDGRRDRWKEGQMEGWESEKRINHKETHLK